MTWPVTVVELTFECDVPCPHCERGPHRVPLTAEVSRGAPVFRGSRPATTTVTVTCPVKQLPVDLAVAVPVAQGERVLAVRVDDQSSARPAGPAPAGLDPGDRPADAEDWRDDVLRAWREDSAALGRETAGKFLAAGTAAVGAYLALLRFVAGESLSGWLLALTVLPAVGYLAVTVLSALVLRPLLVRVHTPDEFERYLERVLRRQSRLLTAVVVVFLASTAAATAALVTAWPSPAPA